MEHPETLSKYLSDARNLILVCNRDMKITYINKAGSKLLGSPQKQVIGGKLLDGVEEHSRSLAADLFEQALGNFEWHGELLLQKVNGDVFPAYISASPITDDDGKVKRVLVIAHDITYRKKLEEDIRKRAELATSIIRTAPIAIFSLDTTRCFKAANHAFSTMLGIRSPGKLLDRPFSDYSGQINPELVKSIEAGLAGEEITLLNKPFKEGAPEELIVSLTVVPTRDREGTTEAVLVLVEDRTELVKVEEQMLQADKLASTGFLAAGIAHEINNPIAGIYTVIEMLAKRVRREGGNEEPYQRILTNIERIKGIIQRLLDFANPAVIQPQKADMNFLVAQVLDFFKFHPIFRRLTVVRDFDESLPKIIVDPKQIQQIFHNLAMNAVQAMKESGGSLTISSKYIEPVGGTDVGYIEYRVRDTGPGIAEVDLKRIFDPFYTTKPPGEGTGLGLSVSYSIAMHHGGDLSARNHPDGGAEFILRIPAITSTGSRPDTT